MHFVRTFQKRNLLLVLFVVMFAAVVLFVRIFYLMIPGASHLADAAKDLHERERVIKAERGKIYDRNGEVLADNMPVCTVSVIHNQITDPERVITVLCKELNLSEAYVRKRVEKYSSIETIKTNVDKEIADAVRAYELDGVMVDEDYRRYYPYGTLASKVLGFTGSDNQGILGLEVKYDFWLKGENGKILRSDWGGTPTFLPNENGKVLNNDFFGGDLKGITSKIPYLKELGVTAIYLNPIFKAFSNHRYDTGDYMTIDPLLGTEKDLVELIDKAKSNGIKIILDGVFNHTGDDSLYFNKYGRYDSVGAYQSKDSPYVDWFNFINYPNVYDSWWGITTLPSVNENSPSYIQFITGENGVLDYYTKLGVSGWRLDVVDELPTKFVRNIRKSVKSANYDATIIGEVWEDASNKIAYGVRREYFQGKELDGVMNYPLKNAIINFVKYGDDKGLSWTVKEQIDHYPKFVLDNVMNILSTHDTARLITVLSGEDMNGKAKDEMAKTFIPNDKLKEAKNKVKMASLLQYTLCGVPSLYYGDEIGMQGYIDPLNRKCYPWDNQDEELLNWYRFLGELREEYSAFKHGDFAEIFADKGAYIFKRFSNDSELLIAVNSGKETVGLQFNDKLLNLVEEKVYENEFILYPDSFAVLIKNKK